MRCRQLGASGAFQCHNEAEPPWSKCRRCLDVIAKTVRTWRAKQKAAGRCRDCGHAPRLPGSVRCAGCGWRSRVYQNMRTLTGK